GNHLCVVADTHLLKDVYSSFHGAPIAFGAHDHCDLGGGLLAHRHLSVCQQSEKRRASYHRHTGCHRPQLLAPVDWRYCSWWLSASPPKALSRSRRNFCNSRVMIANSAS